MHKRYEVYLNYKNLNVRNKFDDSLVTITMTLDEATDFIKEEFKVKNKIKYIKDLYIEEKIIQNGSTSSWKSPDKINVYFLILNSKMKFRDLNFDINEEEKKEQEIKIKQIILESKLKNSKQKLFEE